ncbi:MAG: hypothetical protein JJU05_11475 [Verrucomicrobia bacterium]|nr:hypothetical protein [Verrucomicrobiota bacterium]MCH8528799.1 hypothetical protein [Kiritimatiellia bacterium]
MKTLATLVSQQIWPQLHALPLVKPERLVLLHSSNPKHGLGPASRLQNQLTRWRNDLNLDWAPGQVDCVEISDHDVSAIQASLESLPHPPDLLHLTGGNKLMGFAAFDWAQRRRIPVLYRERELGFVQLDFTPSGIQSRNMDADVSTLSALDPTETVRCQLSEGEIERPGELILLSDTGQRKGRKELAKAIAGGNDCLEWLNILGDADEEAKTGDLLEMQCAAALLKLGIPMVSRSLRLKASETDDQRNSESFQEVDLLFLHQGRLWLVDCKDRAEGGKYRDTGYKALMEDVSGARALGGLDAKIICVRKARFTVGQQLFARDYGIQYVDRHSLVEGLAEILEPRT